MSVCFWESGGTSCFNDDKVIGLRNLVTERDVTERGASSKLIACAPPPFPQNCLNSVIGCLSIALCSSLLRCTYQYFAFIISPNNKYAAYFI